MASDMKSSAAASMFLLTLSLIHIFRFLGEELVPGKIGILCNEKREITGM